MEPTRKANINGHQVHEHYWAGDYVVYVDSKLTAGTFEEVCAALAKAQGDAA